MPRNHKTVLVWYLPTGALEDNEMLPWTNKENDSHVNMLLENAGGRICNVNNVVFKKAISASNVTTVLQSIRDASQNDLFFKLRKNGPMWIVQRTGKYDRL